MLRHWISFVLILSFSLPGMATVGEQSPSDLESADILTALGPDHLRAELKVLQKKHEKIESWDALEETIKKLEGEERAFLLAKLKEWRKAPFKRPSFEATENGFTLREGDQKVMFDLYLGTVTHSGRSLSLDKTTLIQFYSFLTQPPATSSLMSFIVSDAHALGPLVIGLIAFALTSGGIVWRSDCRSSFMRTERRLRDLHSTCQWDLSENRSSPEMRQLVRQLGSTQNQIIRGSHQMCRDHLNRSHRWLFFFSCAENVDSVCQKVSELARCVSALRVRGVNNTELWREVPLQRTPSRGRDAGATGE